MNIPILLPTRFAPGDPLLVNLLASGVLGDDNFAQWSFGPGGVMVSGKASMPTFSRASGATRYNGSLFIETVGSNILRADFDPITGLHLGALFEGQKVNLVSSAAAVGGAGWTNSSGFLSVSTVQSIIAGQQARSFVTDGGSARAVSRTITGVMPNTSYTLSGIFEVDMSQPGTIRLGLRYDNSWIYGTVDYNRVTGMILGDGASSDRRMQILGVGPNGGTLVLLSCVCAVGDLAAGNVALFSYPNAVGNNALSGDSAIIHYIQMEAGGRSSVIFGGNEQTTRQSDTMTVTDMSWFNPTGGVFLAKVRAYPGRTAGDKRAIHIGSGNNMLSLRLEMATGTNYPGAYVGTGSSIASSPNIGGGMPSETEWEYLALAYSPTGCFFGRRKGNAAPLVSVSFGNYSGAAQTGMDIGGNLNGHIGDYGIRYMPGQYNATEVANLLSAIP